MYKLSTHLQVEKTLAGLHLEYCLEFFLLEHKFQERIKLTKNKVVSGNHIKKVGMVGVVFYNENTSFELEIKGGI